MPHAVDEEEDDNALIGRLLEGGPMEELGNIQERQLETGEKANDAEDFEDIGDDELIDDEEAPSKQSNGGVNLLTLANGDATDYGVAATNDADEDLFDDLFNDQGFGTDEGLSPAADQTLTEGDLGSLPQEQQASFETITAAGDSFVKDLDKDARREEEDILDQDPEYLEQMRLFREAYEKRDMPPEPVTGDELFAVIHPQFDPDNRPKFSELLPWKRAQYLSKQPLRPPKPVHPTKISLELQQDQEKAFRLPGPTTTPYGIRQAEADAQGITLIIQPRAEQDYAVCDELESLGSDAEADVGQYKWSDLVAICQDWDMPLKRSGAVDHSKDYEFEFNQPLNESSDDRNFRDLIDQPSSKKRKMSNDPRCSLPIFYNSPAIFDDPEAETAKLSRGVRLDMNDPRMLIDVQQPERVNERKRKYGQFKRDNTRGLTKDFARRYNISNDEAYDQLKENRQSKVRSTLGGMAIEHSLPAARLQYPFYKVRLTRQEARSFHRPSFAIDPTLARFSSLKHKRRKEQRRKTTQELFASTAELSQNDNSHMLLLEYSEEYPAMLSGFGMGNRLINYYRRRDEADHSRPKYDVGETEILTREDKSPFSIFGDVDPGSTQPTLSNGMFRAPVFAHASNSQDFLLISNKTSMGGRNLFLKNLENLHTVGQEFPSIEVPGTHSRKVTDASKRRLRMLSYRMFRKHKKVKNEMIQRHLPGSDIAQNRSKMREIMNYDKDRGWLPRETEVPDETTIRSWIKPEDICLLEAMQVGDRQLKDSGFTKESNASDDEDTEGKTIEEQLAPWQTTKNFLNACQGKAMLQLHGAGDPTGRGEGFDFIRTSMKGGFKPAGESIEDRLSSRNPKELGGHSYNVARQQRVYNESIHKIWQAQRNSLSSTQLHDVDMEDPDEVDARSHDRGRTPGSAVPGRSRRDDEVGSTFSRNSNASGRRQVLRIARNIRDQYGQISDVKTEYIHDMKVAREYLRRKHEQEMSHLRYAQYLSAHSFSMPLTM